MPKLAIPAYVEEIREKCTSIDDAVEIILEANKITAPPINVVKIANDMKFKVYSVDFKDENVVGIIVDSEKPLERFDNHQRVIAIDRRSYTTRTLFTIAHEIGHFVMHCGDMDDFFQRDVYGDSNSIDKRSPMEKKADKFAACLLLPKKMFIDFVLNCPFYKAADEKKLIQAIQKTFIVSETTAFLRLKEVDLNYNERYT